LTDEMRREHNENFEELHRLAQASPIGMPFNLPTVSALEVEPEESKEMLNRLYNVGGFRFHFTSFTDIVTNRDANAVVAGYVEDKIRERVKDPAKADVLCEFNHPIGTKRPPIDTEYLEAFNRDNVSIVSIRENPIREVTEDGLTLENGDHYHLDALVFATGFDTVTGTLLKLNLRGKNGQTLHEKWKDGPRTYLGLASANFPNLFMVTGPQSPAILVNFPTCIEKHVDWVSNAINYVRASSAEEFEADVQAEDEWVELISASVEGTLMTTVDSWYMNSNIPGKPKVFTAYFAGWPTYAEIIDDVVAQGYKGFNLNARESSEAA
jgi:cation diffusion facilitator CzcD-associated flavoprotein CzcO